MKSRYPRPLPSGGTVGIMAPSSRIDHGSLDTAVDIILSRGYQVAVHPQTYCQLHQSAGSGSEKAAALHDLIENDEIDAIFFARGGNRASTMLDQLDFSLIRKYAKPLLGYSDATILLNAIERRSGVIGFHGPMSHGLAALPKKQVNQCFALLSGNRGDISMPRARVVKQGVAEGRICGGNLSLVCAAIGTAYAPDFNDRILLIEDVAEESSRIDRNLFHLRNAGVFHAISGLVLGTFSHTKDTGNMKFGFSLKQSLTEAIADFDFPVVMNAPFGHGRDLYTLPIGGHARLSTNGNVSELTLL